MKILIVSYFFPPAATVASVRLGGLASQLELRGHDVRVLTTRDAPFPQSMAVPLHEERVTATKAWNINRAPALLAGGQRQIARKGVEATSRTRTFLKRTYHQLLVPDAAVGWVPFALRASARLSDVWQPDVVFATFSPASSLVVGGAVARRTGVPWVADFRDLWVGNPYSEASAWRQALDRKLAASVLSNVSAITTISEPLAEDLRRLYTKPVTVIPNGYDPQSLIALAEAEAMPIRADRLIIRHMGSIYPGKRDPSNLFAAVAGSEALRDNVTIEFYGTYLHQLPQLAADYGLDDQNVRVFEPVDHDESRWLQARSHVLLLLTWDSPAERGTMPAKVFEYIGSRRPILGVGGRDGVAADLIREEELGSVATSVEDIQRILLAYLQELRSTGRIRHRSAMPESASRLTQTLKLESLLLGVTGEGRA